MNYPMRTILWNAMDFIWAAAAAELLCLVESSRYVALRYVAAAPGGGRMRPEGIKDLSCLPRCVVRSPGGGGGGCIALPLHCIPPSGPPPI